MLARVQMLLHHAGRIGERHRPAGEGAETRACVPVQIFEWKCLGVFAGHDFSRDARNRPRNGDQSVPLCLKPERLAQPELCRRRLHLRRGGKPRLSRVSFPSTVLLPERFRAISPSATAFGCSLPQTGRASERPLDEFDASPRTPLCHALAARQYVVVELGCRGRLAMRIVAHRNQAPERLADWVWKPRMHVLGSHWCDGTLQIRAMAGCCASALRLTRASGRGSADSASQTEADECGSMKTMQL